MAEKPLLIYIADFMSAAHVWVFIFGPGLNHATQDAMPFTKFILFEKKSFLWFVLIKVKPKVKIAVTPNFPGRSQLKNADTTTIPGTDQFRPLSLAATD